MPPRAVTKRSTRRPSIVFADNDPLVREAIVELLRSKGYDVHVAEDGLAAWEGIRHVRPTYVILDVVMPKLDGAGSAGSPSGAGRIFAPSHFRNGLPLSGRFSISSGVAFCTIRDPRPREPTFCAPLPQPLLLFSSRRQVLP